MTVEIQDANGNIVPTATDNISLAFGTDPSSGAATLGGTLTVAAINGVATFSDINIDKAFTGYTLQAGAAGLTAGTSSAFNITPATKAQLAFIQAPSNAEYNTNITPAMTVQIQDSFGNKTADTDSITLVINNNPTGGTLSGTVAKAAVNGVATFNDIQIDTAGVGYTLNATAAGLTTATSTSFNITATPTQIIITQGPTDAYNLANITPAITVELRDATNAIVTSATNAVTLAFGTDPSTGTAVIGGTKTVSAVAGVATFSNINIDTVNNGYTFTFTATGLTSATSAAFNITQAPATKLAFIQNPTTAVAGVTFSPSITVQIQDTGGNIVTTATDSITLSSSQAVNGTATVAAVAGVATFNSVNMTTAGSSYTMTASATGLTSATSTSFNIDPATKAQLAFVQEPSNTQYATNISPAMTVEIQDSYGNKTTDTDSISLVINNNPSGGTLSGTTSSAAVAGLATFSDIQIDNIGTGYTLNATSGALTLTTSSAFNIEAGNPTQLIITGQPSNSSTGVVISPAMTVELRDAGNNLVSSATNQVTLSFNTDPSAGGASISGTVTRNAVGGIATFNDISIDKAYTGYKFGFAATGLTGAVSNTFDILAPYVSSVTPPASGTYGDTQNLDFTANISSAVTVSGTPRIQLNIGGSTVYANYQAGLSTSTALVFRYTVTGSDNDLDGIQHFSPIDLNSGTIADASANNATLTFTPASTTGVVVSNGTPGITVTPLSGPIYEVGTTSATFSVTLDAAPSANVTMSVTSLDTTEGTIDKSSLTFTSANWSTPQVVTVTAVDDLVVDGNIVFQIDVGIASSSDGNYNGLNPANVFATCIDGTTTPAITVTAISGNTTEDGGTATFNIVLGSAPTGDVTVGLTSNDTGEGTVSPSSVTFTSGNWAIAQTVTVTGVDDAIEDSDQLFTIVTAAATSTDSNYSGMNPVNVNVVNEDNDSIGFFISAISSDVNETGTTATFSVKLKSPPTNNVTLPISSTDTTEGTIDVGATLTFTPANWNTPQVVTVTGVDDILEDGDQPFQIDLGSSTSTDPNYNGIDPTNISLLNLDDDSFGISVSAKSTDTTETGGSGTFQIVLNSPPTGDVTIGITSSNTNEATVNPASVTFTSGNWSTPQTVTATGVDDILQDGNQLYSIVTAPATSTDPNYNGMDPANVTFYNIDDDSNVITVSPTSGLIVSESGTEDTFTIVLGSAPSGDVTIPISSLDTSEGTVSPTSVTFTSTDWSIPKTITVTGVDDASQDGNKTFSINVGTASSTDPNYNGLNPTDVLVSCTDDDTIGVYFSYVNSSNDRYPLQETGTFKTIDVNLTSKPAAGKTVTITYYEEDPAEGIATPTTGLTFTDLNWNVPQTITVTGIDDGGAADGDDSWELFYNTVSSTDPNYNGLSLVKTQFVTIDDDSAGVIITPETWPNQIIVFEEGPTEEYQIVLRSPPTDDVTISMTRNDTSEGTIFPSSFTFTPENWNVAQTGYVTGMDDGGIVDGIQLWQIDGTSTSNDNSYNGLGGIRVRFMTVDDDKKDYFVTPDSSTSARHEVNETGTQKQISIRLTKAPTANVTLYPYSTDTSEGMIAETSITFTPENWSSPQYITVIGVDDTINDGDRSFDIRWNNTSSSDPGYGGIEPARIYFRCIDNE